MTQEENTKACKRCDGKGSYMYDEHHGKICEVCCLHGDDFFRLEDNYGNDNGRMCCLRGCGFIKDNLSPELVRAIKDIVWMARRYAEGRMTGAPDIFNESYRRLSKIIKFDEENDPDNRFDDHRPIKNFPLATRGEY